MSIRVSSFPASPRWRMIPRFLLSILALSSTASWLSNAFTLSHQRQHSRIGQATTTSATHRFLSSSPTSSSSSSTATASNSGSSGGISLSKAIEDAAANFIQESCPLLGVKSLGVDYGLVRTGIAVTVGYNPEPLDILVWEPPSPPKAEADEEEEDRNDQFENTRRRRRRRSNNNNEKDTTVEPSLPGNTTQIAIQVVEIAQREQAAQIIVGLPLHKNGTEAEQTMHTRVFAAELAEHVLQRLGPNVPVYLWDERYTSKEAAARAHSKDPSRSLYGTLDAEAACIILEHYYNDNGEGAEVAAVQDKNMVMKYTLLWEQRKHLEEERLRQEEMARSDRLLRRKEAILRDQQIMEQQQSDEYANNKKKKKRKRKK